MEARYWAALDRFVELCGREWEREERRQRRREREWAKVVATSTGLQPKDIKATVEGIFRLAAKQMKKYRGSFELAGMLKLEAYEAKCPKYTKIRFRIWKVGPRVVFVKHVPMAVKATPMKKLIEMVQLKDEFRFVNWV